MGVADRIVELLLFTMKTSIDNTALVKKFLRGGESLLANRELRVEQALDETQLLTIQGTILAKGRLTDPLPNIVIRLDSDYWELIHQLALEASFIPLTINQDRLAGATFIQHSYHSVPAGYQIHCQEASAFWKRWWLNHRKLQLMDMLLLHNNRWYPVSQMLCDTGSIYVKTWRGEQVLYITDRVVWLDRNTQEKRKRIEVNRHQAKAQDIPIKYPYHLPDRPPGHCTVPADLAQVIKAGKDRLLVRTAVGIVLIEGQNLTCKLARKLTQVS